MSSKLARLLQLTSTYLPLVGTFFVLLVATFDSSLLNTVPLSLLLALMALSFVFVTAHLEWRLFGLQTSVESLEEGVSARVSALEETHRSYLDATTPAFRTGSLAEAFDRALHGRDRIGHLRIYAISSQQIFSFISNSMLIVDRCSLLIQGFPDDDRSDFAHQVRLVARDWHKLASTGRVRELEIHAYDYFPTDYEVLIDSDFLIFGLFDYDPDDYSKVGLRAATVIDGSSPDAESLIIEFRDRFDRLFKACETGLGPNPYEKT
jgi:hypothetical protein